MAEPLIARLIRLDQGDVPYILSYVAVIYHRIAETPESRRVLMGDIVAEALVEYFCTQELGASRMCVYLLLQYRSGRTNNQRLVDAIVKKVQSGVCCQATPAVLRFLGDFARYDEGVIQECMRQMERGDEPTRAAAAKALAQAATPRFDVRAALLGALADPAASVRAAAVEALATLGEPIPELEEAE